MTQIVPKPIAQSSPTPHDAHLLQVNAHSEAGLAGEFLHTLIDWMVWSYNAIHESLLAQNVEVISTKTCPLEQKVFPTIVAGWVQTVKANNWASLIKGLSEPEKAKVMQDLDLQRSIQKFYDRFCELFTPFVERGKEYSDLSDNLHKACQVYKNLEASLLFVLNDLQKQKEWSIYSPAAHSVFIVTMPPFKNSHLFVEDASKAGLYFYKMHQVSAWRIEGQPVAVPECQEDIENYCFDNLFGLILFDTVVSSDFVLLEYYPRPSSRYKYEDVKSYFSPDNFTKFENEAKIMVDKFGQMDKMEIEDWIKRYFNTFRIAFEQKIAKVINAIRELHRSYHKTYSRFNENLKFRDIKNGWEFYQDDTWKGAVVISRFRVGSPTREKDEL
jgi:hypothetical protein